MAGDLEHTIAKNAYLTSREKRGPELGNEPFVKYLINSGRLLNISLVILALINSSKLLISHSLPTNVGNVIWIKCRFLKRKNYA